MIARHVDKLRWSYRKNAPDLLAILTRNYPAFVWQRPPPELRDEMPVFTFHTVEPGSFEEQLQHLQRNGYRSLTGAEFRGAMAGELPVPARSVVLTFDDGRASLRTVAYPLLRKYGFRAVAFIIPGLIPESAPRVRDYDDLQAQRASAKDLLAREQGGEPLCSWQEIAEMHESGVIEFQSHTMYHHQVCVSPQVVDFMHPRFQAYFFGNINVPAYFTDGDFDYRRKMPWGTPVYRSEPRMAGKVAYYDDQRLRDSCRDFVQQESNGDFFARPNWRRRLLAFYERERKANGNGRFETPAQQRQSIAKDLADSKRLIEERLGGKPVTQLCFPWFMGSPVAVRAAREAGYQVCYWGVVPGRNTNRKNQSLYYVPRLEDHYIFRLPGEGRRKLLEILQTKFNHHLPAFARRMYQETTDYTT